MIRITPDCITSLKQEEVFVFGSNLQGRHFSGAAKIAHEKFGAKMGIGFGLQGQSYAIPTMPGDLMSIKMYVQKFIVFAKNNYKKRFYVTLIGCGIAGYTPEQIAPFFLDATECTNVFLPQPFWEIIEKQKRLKKYRENAQEVTYSLSVTTNNTSVKTSNYLYFSIDVQIQNQLLIVSSGIANVHISLCTILKDVAGNIIEKDYLDGQCQFVKNLPNLTNESYVVDLYFQKDSNGDYYRQLSLPIENVKKISLSHPKFYKQNIRFVNSIPVDSVFLKKQTTLTAVVPGALIEFRDLANKITKYDSSEYNKLLSIHDWVAKNIFYDYDSLYDGSYKNIPLEKTAITALRNKRCVCQGYTDLSVALLRSVGIPAMGIRCWAVGEGDDEDALKDNRSNHIFTAAFCDGRWILCDITWDSKNRYEKNSYDEDKKLSHTYFDATVQFMSYTHKFVGY